MTEATHVKVEVACVLEKEPPAVTVMAEAAKVPTVVKAVVAAKEAAEARLVGVMVGVCLVAVAKGVDAMVEA